MQKKAKSQAADATHEASAAAAPAPPPATAKGKAANKKSRSEAVAEQDASAATKKTPAAADSTTAADGDNTEDVAQQTADQHHDDGEEEPSEVDSFLLEDNEGESEDSEEEDDRNSRLDLDEVDDEEEGDEEDDDDEEDDEDDESISEEDEVAAAAHHHHHHHHPHPQARHFHLTASNEDEDDDEDLAALANPTSFSTRCYPTGHVPRNRSSGEIQSTVDPETQARLEALLEAAGISKLAGETKITDPEVLKHLTSSVSSALDEAAAALTRMRSDPPPDGRSLVEACNEGDIHKVRKLLDEGHVSVNDTTEEGESLLSLACSAGYFELAQVLLAMRANVEDRGVKGDCTPLMEASSAGHLDIVKLLIAHAADVNAQSSSGNTPLMYACAGGHEAVVKTLLESGANVEDHNENGHTPLMEAASAGHVGVAKVLLSFGAGINTHSNEFKESALTLACYKGHLEMVRFLLEAGADQEHKTDEMHTALMEASMDGHVEVARLLLDSGAQVNMPADSFESPLTLAACGGHVELAMLLLERGANIEEVNDEGYTPLMEAAREGHEEMVALLLSQGADINAQTEETQETALTLACCGGFLEVADFLIKAGADLEVGASTPLMEAAQEGHLELVRYLLEAGSSVNAQTGTGDTALTYASENGHTEVAELLLSHGAALEHESEGGRTPLMKAARAGHLATVRFLLDKGADVNRATSNNDHTPLSLACAGGHQAVVEVLLQHGADPFHKLKDNSTMLIEAAKGGHAAVVQMLIDYPNTFGGPALEASAILDMPTNVAGANANMPCPGNEALLSFAADGSKAKLNNSSTSPSLKSVLRKTQHRGAATGGAVACPKDGGGGTVAGTGAGGKAAKTSAPLYGSDSPGYDFLENSGFMLEGGLATKGLDAKSYIQSLQNSGQPDALREVQIQQKEQILAELQRVERELQQKANEQRQQQQQQQHQQREAGVGATSSSSPGECQHRHQQQPPSPGGGGPPPASLCSPVSLGTSPTTSGSGSELQSQEILQSLADLSLENKSTLSSISTATAAAAARAATVALANLPPSERPKAKPSRKIDGKGAKKSSQQLHAALQQHSQQLAQLQQLQQLNQQLQQQVLQQRQLKQQNQATLQALQQNAIANQQQLAALQENVAQLQQLEQNILAQQQQQQQQLQTSAASPSSAAASASANSNQSQQHQQLQARVQQILQQKQQLQQQIKQFQHQVEQQLAYTQHTTNTVAAAAAASTASAAASPGGGKNSNKRNKEGADKKKTNGEDGKKLVPFEPPLELQASQALQAVQVLQNLDLSGAEAGVVADIEPLIQDPTLLGNVDPALFAAAMHNCSIPIDLNSQALLSGYKDGLQAAAASGAIQLQYPGLPNAFPGDPTGQQMGSFGLLQTSPLAYGQAGDMNFSADLQYLQGMPHGDTIYLPASGSAAAAANADQVAHHMHYHHSGVQPDLPPALPANAAPPAQKVANKMSAAAPCKKTKTAPSGSAVSAKVSKKMTDLSVDAAGELFDPSQYGNNVPIVDLDSETDSNHDTALTLACAGGHEDLVRLLLERGADIEHRDKKGFTPLILAATAGHDKVVEILLDHSAEIEAQSERTKDTPLSLACSGGRYEVVELLLSRAANKEHRNVSDYTPLSLAASGGYVNIIKLLLAHKAEINSRTGSKLGISPLMLAAMNGHTAAVKLLLDEGSDINAQIETNRNTALTLACFQGRHEVVSLLLDRRANVEHRAKTGLTPLMEAASGGYVEVGRVLLDKGADVNAPPVPSSRDTALTIAADKGHYRFVELLLTRGAQVDVRNKKGNTSLWLAANGGHLDVVQLLYSAGADIDAQDNRKVSCLMAAFRKGHSKVVKWMVRHVAQFPSDQELTRYIATIGIGDKDLLKKCHQCMEIIRVAKDRQAAEAAKNASILLEELDRESKLEQSKKEAAARKREKKKRKKLEKQGKSSQPEEDSKKKDEEDDDDDDVDSDIVEIVEEEKEKTPPVIEAPVPVPVQNHVNDVNENSAQDGNAKRRDSKRIKNKGKNKEVPLPPQEEVVAVPAPAPKIMEEKAKEVEALQQCRVPVTPEGHSVTAHANGGLSPPQNQESGRGKTNARSRRATNDESAHQLRHSEVVLLKPTSGNAASQPQPQPTGLTPTKRGTGQTSTATRGGQQLFKGDHHQQSSGGGALPDGPQTAGWKEVVRKSKKVSVPANAISRVIGRGGCNINAIRELSGAHIEVEKQVSGKGGADRSILIKGSADATRQAHTWIQAIISSPDKDMADIIGKQFKTLHQQASVSGGGATASKQTTPAPVPAVPATAKATPQSGKAATATATTKASKANAADSKKATAASATVAAATAKLANGTVTGAALAASASTANSGKNLKVASAGSTFAAVAGGSANASVSSSSGAVSTTTTSHLDSPSVGMIATGSHPGAQKPAALSGSNKNNNSNKTTIEQNMSHPPPPSQKQQQQQSQQQQQATERGRDYSPFKVPTSAPAGAAHNAPVSNNSALPRGESLTSGKEFSPFRLGMDWGAGLESGFGLGGKMSAPFEPESLMKVDMSKAPGYRGSPINTSAASVMSTWAPHNMEKPPQVDVGGLFQQPQERCNSAPGTPMSPSVPAPIGPPPQSKTTVSPVGSEPDQLRSRVPPMGSSGLTGFGRSMTPDADMDLRSAAGLGHHPPATSMANRPSSVTGFEKREFFGGPSANKSSTYDLSEQILSAAAQMASLNTGGGGGFSDYGFAGSSDFGAGLFSTLMPPSSSSVVPPRMAMGGGNMFSQQQQSSRLNPNAPDFLRIQTPNADYLRAPNRMPNQQYHQMRNQQQQQQFGGQYGGGQRMSSSSSYSSQSQGINASAYSNILSNQSINSFLSQHHGDLNMDAASFFSGRSLKEINDMLGGEGGAGGGVFGQPPPPSFMSMPPPPAATGPNNDLGQHGLSRPIGAERRGGASKPNIPSAPWDVSSIYEPGNGPSNSSGGANNSNSSAASGGGADMTNGLQSLSGHTLDSLMKAQQQGAGGHDSPTPNYGLGLHSPAMGLSPSGTPNKMDYPDYLSGGGSAGKKMGGMGGYIVDRGDAASVRKNMNQQWSKKWTDE